jgi:hypothetical protein
MPKKTTKTKNDPYSFIFAFKDSFMYVSGRPIFSLSSKIRAMGATWNAPGAPVSSWTFDLSLSVDNNNVYKIMDHLQGLYEAIKAKKAASLLEKKKRLFPAEPAIAVEQLIKPLASHLQASQPQDSESKTSVFRNTIHALSAKSAAVSLAMSRCTCQDDYYRLQFQLHQISAELFEAADYLENVK